jgi:multicomponent Na+:H+ antiporter subunit B
VKLPDIFFRTVATPIVFVLIALGFHFFLRGHNAPGGGFIAGLIIAGAALFARMAQARRLLAIRTETLVPLGLLLAALTGIPPMLFQRPFMKSSFGFLNWPVIGEFEWASVMLFDLGIFAVVVGTTVTIIDLLADDRKLTRLGTDVEREEP